MKTITINTKIYDKKAEIIGAIYEKSGISGNFGLNYDALFDVLTEYKSVFSNINFRFLYVKNFRIEKPGICESLSNVLDDAGVKNNLKK